MKYTVGILAGGKSSRMGQNKALLEFCNDTIIGRIIKAFDPNKEIIVSAADRGVYERDGISVVYDENKDIGPIEGIRQVLRASSSKYVFICAADMPFITESIADHLAGYISSDYDCYVIEDDERKHPLCAVYSRDVIPVIEELIAEGNLRLMDLLRRVRTKYISLAHTSFEKKILKNINTRAEYIKLKRPVVFAVSGYKDSGKTWLITELINEFIADGYKVGVIKHDGHDVIAEAEGTDTYLFRQKGAAVTAVFSDTRYVISSDGRKTAEELIMMLKKADDDLDIIILEGFKDSSYPKIEIVKDGKHCASDRSSVFLSVTDFDVKKICSAVKEEFEL